MTLWLPPPRKTRILGFRHSSAFADAAAATTLLRPTLRELELHQDACAIPPNSLRALLSRSSDARR